MQKHVILFEKMYTQKSCKDEKNQVLHTPKITSYNIHPARVIFILPRPRPFNWINAKQEVFRTSYTVLTVNDVRGIYSYIGVDATIFTAAR